VARATGTWSSTIYNERNRRPPLGWAVVTASGAVHVHPTRRADPDEWLWVLAHCLLHLGMGHFENWEARERTWALWGAACDYEVNRFLAQAKLGRPPEEHGALADLGNRSAENLYAEFLRNGPPDVLPAGGLAGPRTCDMVVEPVRSWGNPPDWKAYFAQGITEAVDSALNVAAGRAEQLGTAPTRITRAQTVRAWFINSYPLLGALAASFRLVEDSQICQRINISVAAIDEVTQEVYLNPLAGLSEAELKFVMAHEFLHVALRHLGRRLGRDPFLWNAATDFVINHWLVEMKIGAVPILGLLHDPSLTDVSAEALYDLMAQDLRRARRLATFRGAGLGDMLERDRQGGAWPGDGTTLDDFYRSCLAQGLQYHLSQGRGFLPAGLIEEIRALSQPPIPWDVQLAHWFETWFDAIEEERTFARPSRRQASTPDIPRPRWVTVENHDQPRTFGVVLDTSGSMDRALLAKGLGSVASYALAHEVPLVRLVFCDAAAYDQGYVAPEMLLESVSVKGRGGTVLQPGIDLVERAEDFPKDGPLLIVTDGYCDQVHVQRPHAFLIPEGGMLPFLPRGPVFRIS